MKKTQSDSGLAFDGLALNGDSIYKYNTKYQKNEYTGHANDGRLVNKGRGPTKVGSGSTGVSGTNPPKTASGREQKRNPSGTREVPQSGVTNAGIGPRKGNAQ